VFDFRPIFFVVGLLLTTLAVAMCAPLVVDLAAGHHEWRMFAGSAALTAFIGVTMILTTRSTTRRINIRQAFILTTGSWLVLTTFSALPFAFSELGLSFTDAFFEAMSGITTTGSTVITTLDTAPKGILLWRALLQWLGGIGIIVMAIAVLPMLKIGGMQLFRMESSDHSEKVMPRVTQVASGIGLVYLALTVICALALWAAGFDGFDAVAHSMTTIATGGFSTSDASIGGFKNPAAEIIVTVFMIVGGLPFVLYLQAVRGEVGALYRDSQVRWFMAIVVICIAVLGIWHHVATDASLETSYREVAFNVVSIITGTGFSSADYGGWGAFAVGMFFFLMFVGGCAGSTTCGIKVFRFQVLYATAEAQIHRLVQPHGVFVPHFNKQPITEEIASSVMGFFFLFVIIFAGIALALGAIGLDFITAVSGAATAICNVGPALGDIIGPTGNFASLPDAAKWVLSVGMLLGRLELFTVMVMLAPSFWRG
jgi:trk system potassium uptake protein TrkH